MIDARPQQTRTVQLRVADLFLTHCFLHFTNVTDLHDTSKQRLNSVDEAKETSSASPDDAVDATLILNSFAEGYSSHQGGIPASLITQGVHRPMIFREPAH